MVALLVRGEDPFSFLDRIHNVVCGVGNIWDICLPDMQRLHDYNRTLPLLLLKIRVRGEDPFHFVG